MIDRIWRLWQLRHPGARPPGGILDEALPPFRMTVRQTLVGHRARLRLRRRHRLDPGPEPHDRSHHQPPLELPELEDVDDLSRADLVFYGVDHSGPSYEARVFINNPAAAATRARRRATATPARSRSSATAAATATRDTAHARPASPTSSTSARRTRCGR